MSKSLLVADDSLTIRKVIGMIFATEDVQITAVDNGLEAISKARELRPDLVLADVTMPGRSGYEVCEAIKADPNTEGVPVLLLAGTFEPFDENRARAAKADDYIVKPFESQALLDKVRTLTGMPRQPETPRQIFVPESASGARPAAPPSAAQRMPAAAGPRPPSSTSFPGSGGPPRPSAPNYSMGQPAPSRGPPAAGPAGVAPQGGMRPVAPMPMSHSGFARPPSAAVGANPALSRTGAQGPAMPQYRPPPSAIPRPGPATGAPGGNIPGPSATSLQYRPVPAAPQPPRASAPAAVQSGFGRSGPAPIPRPAYAPAPVPPRADPYASPQLRGQPQYGPPAGTYQPLRYGEVPLAGQPAPAPVARADGGEALLREALSKASRDVIEKVVWEVVPQLAETIIREHLDRLIAEREGRT